MVFLCSQKKKKSATVALRPFGLTVRRDKVFDRKPLIIRLVMGSPRNSKHSIYRLQIRAGEHVSPMMQGRHQKRPRAKQGPAVEF